MILLEVASFPITLTPYFYCRFKHWSVQFEIKLAQRRAFINLSERFIRSGTSEIQHRKPETKTLSICRHTIAVLMFVPLAGSAVVPLTTDDADPVDFGHLQLNSGLSFSRMAAANFYDYSVNPVLGITSRSEFGVTFGYRAQDDGGKSADGMSDVILETKWRLIGTATNLFKLSARFDMKLPVASERLGLGTGHPDADLILIATRSWGKTSLDWNIGYTSVAAGYDDFGDDRWFFGQSLRQQLNDRWTLIGDAYVTFSQGRSSTPVNFNFEGGTQFSLRDNFQFSALIGSAVGRNSPDLTGYLGFSWTF